MPGKSKRCNFTLDAETIALLKDMAEKQDMSQSQLLRRLIREASKKKQ